MLNFIMIYAIINSRSRIVQKTTVCLFG